MDEALILRVFWWNEKSELEAPPLHVDLVLLLL